MHASDLKPGERLVTITSNGDEAADGTVGIAVVESVETDESRLANPRATVYNFEVGGVHRYAVTDAGVVVHNVGCEKIAGKLAGYSRHGIDSAISRNGVGVLARAILDTLRNSLRIVLQSEGRTRIIGNNAVVVLNSEGRLITTWARTRSAWRIIAGGP